MGCFNSTCGITGLPIQYEDPVVIVTIKDTDPLVIPCYDKKGDLVSGRVKEIDSTPTMEEIISRNGISKIEAIRFGTYNDYGWLQEEEMEKDDRPDYRSFYFHRWAWEWCLTFKNLVKYVEDKHSSFVDQFLKTKERVEKIKGDDAKSMSNRFVMMSLFRDLTDISYEFFEENYENKDYWRPFIELKVVLLVCQEMRKDPVSMNYYLGSQRGDESLRLIRRLLPKIQEHIDRVEKKHNEESTEPWDDGSDDDLFWYTKF